MNWKCLGSFFFCLSTNQVVIFYSFFLFLLFISQDNRVRKPKVICYPIRKVPRTPTKISLRGGWKQTLSFEYVHILDAVIARLFYNLTLKERRKKKLLEGIFIAKEDITKFRRQPSLSLSLSLLCLTLSVCVCMSHATNRTLYILVCVYVLYVCLCAPGSNVYVTFIAVINPFRLQEQKVGISVYLSRI